MKTPRKKRLDTILLERGLADDLAAAAALIGTGRVLVEGNALCKAGTLYRETVQVTVKQKEPYVSRGGKKLAAGLAAFSLDPCGLVCADVGCSTGGFTDCLLKSGAARVYAIDVGYGVLDWTLRQDERVVVMERCNARYLKAEDLPERLDFCVVDASFISLELLLKPITQLFSEEISIVVLVKPQFELSRRKVARGGVVKERHLQAEALEKVMCFARSLALDCRGVIPSPLQGAKGNQEYLMYLTGVAGKVASAIKGENHER